MSEAIIVRNLGRLDYAAAVTYQEELLRGNVSLKQLAREQAIDPRDSGTKHYLLFVEHPPVLTLGKSGNIGNLLVSEERLKHFGVSFYRTNRGGDITYHGPGQVVGYPILDLEKFDTDIGHYLRNIEQAIILTLADYNILAGRSPGETGVWLDAGNPGKARKICAIGIRCSRWVTMHGFALNVNTDLRYFDYIIPCGIQNKQVTSMQKELGKPVDAVEVMDRLKIHFAEVFGAVIVEAEEHEAA
ncbi:MAG TPA: lipoyl(octanoyl) transferase LipB [Chitinophagaceae bacterium]